jgi:hypothetical protein
MDLRGYPQLEAAVNGDDPIRAALVKGVMSADHYNAVINQWAKISFLKQFDATELVECDAEYGIGELGFGLELLSAKIRKIVRDGFDGLLVQSGDLDRVHVNYVRTVEQSAYLCDRASRLSTVSSDVKEYRRVLGELEVLEEALEQVHGRLYQ